MKQPNSTDCTRPKKFDPIIGWISLACLLLIFAAVVRVNLRSKGQIPLIQQNRFRIDINHASMPELMALPNLGPATASKIVEHRKKHGAFQNVEQLLRVPGIGPETLRTLRPLLLIVPSEDTDDSLAKN